MKDVNTLLDGAADKIDDAREGAAQYLPQYAQGLRYGWRSREKQQEIAEEVEGYDPVKGTQIQGWTQVWGSGIGGLFFVVAGSPLALAMIGSSLEGWARSEFPARNNQKPAGLYDTGAAVKNGVQTLGGYAAEDLSQMRSRLADR